MSYLYETQPLYYENQPWFLNAVVSGSTGVSPFRLLDAAHTIEYKAGRRREKEEPKGPRVLDIDILLYDMVIIRSERLTIPHGLMEERRFVLAPLLELAPHIRNPLTGVPYSKIAERLAERLSESLTEQTVRRYVVSPS
jgi:2-amino-4-hydroxy-6-hydroxymethyldihydropteridine diphosphokinase